MASYLSHHHGHGNSGYHSSSSTPGMPTTLMPGMDLFPLEGSEQLGVFGGGEDHGVGASASWISSFGIADGALIGLGGSSSSSTSPSPLAFHLALCFSFKPKGFVLLPVVMLLSYYFPPCPSPRVPPHLLSFRCHVVLFMLSFLARLGSSSPSLPTYLMIMSSPLPQPPQTSHIYTYWLHNFRITRNLDSISLSYPGMYRSPSPPKCKFPLIVQYIFVCVLLQCGA